jgi:pimeloyl-ACP methyl ester carboxylesterase
LKVIASSEYCSKQITLGVAMNVDETDEKDLIERTVDSSYGKLHVVECNGLAGTTILCFHGDTKRSTWEIYKPIMQPLAQQGFRVISLDMPGYGESEGVRSAYRDTGTALFKELVKVLTLQTPVMIAGRAIGGRIALECAVAYPRLVSKLLLSHPSSPTVDTLARVKQSVLLTWAVDDKWGQPFFGPHGASFFLKHCPVDLCVWSEAEFETGPQEFYRTLFVERALEFIRRKRKSKKRKSKSPTIKPRQGSRSPPSGPLKPAAVAVPNPVPVMKIEEAKEESTPTQTQTVKKPAKQDKAVVLSIMDALSASSKSKDAEQPVPVVKKPFRVTLVAEPELPGMAVAVEEKGEHSLEEGEQSLEEDVVKSTWVRDTQFGDIHMLEVGQKESPVFLVMHGDGRLSSCEHWRMIMVPLAAAGVRVLSLDMPGYGKSTGKRWSFRNEATEVVRAVVDRLKIKEFIVAGRSVGGKATFLVAHALGKQRVKGIVATHPVAPPSSILGSVRMPTMITWAVDDAKTNLNSAGHPYFGPKGAHFFVKQVGADLVSWYESDYEEHWHADFYRSVYVSKVLSFGRRIKFFPRTLKK